LVGPRGQQAVSATSRDVDLVCPPRQAISRCFVYIGSVIMADTVAGWGEWRAGHRAWRLRFL